MISFSAKDIAESPIKRTALIIVAGILLNAAFIYFVALPVRGGIATTAQATSDTEENNDRIRKVISTTAEKRTAVDELEKEHARLASAGVLTPLLNSYTMRAKTLIEPFAAEYGLNLENVKELAVIPLKRSPVLTDTAYARLPVEFTTSGSYTQIVAFISRVEDKLPMTTLSSLKILAQNRDPESHQAAICWEWLIEESPIKEN